MKTFARPLLGLFIAASLAGCGTAPGTGWSRAPDLSVYAAMGLYADVARQHSVLCGGFRPLVVDDRWREDFGARQDAVTAALVTRYGAGPVGAARDRAIRAVPCRDVPDLSWRHQYERMLRLLEARLGLA